MKILSKINLSPFLRDVILTGITSVLVVISLIFVTRFLAMGLGPEGFGAFALARRLVSFILPFSTLSLGIALTRYLAISEDNTTRSGYFIAAAVIIVCTSMLILLFGYAGHDRLTILIFHDLRYIDLFHATLVMIVGYGVYEIIYAYYRGIQRIDIANLWQIVVMAIFPLLIAYVYGRQNGEVSVIFLMGLAAFLCLVPSAVLVKKAPLKSPASVLNPMGDLMRYGVPRAPGGLALYGMLVIGPLIAPYIGTLKDAGYLVIGQSVLRVTETFVVAFGLVALPKVTQLFSEGKIEFLKERINDIIAMILHVGIFASVQLFLLSHEIVVVWLGEEYLPAVPVVKVLIVASCPYLGYVMLRSIIDAVEVRAVNTLNLLIALVIATILSVSLGYSGLGIVGIALGIMIGFFFLGVSSAGFLVKKYSITLVNMHLVPVLLVNIMFTLGTLLLKLYVARYFHSFGMLAVMLVIELVFFALYLWFLDRRRIQWIQEFKIRLFHT